MTTQTLVHLRAWSHGVAVPICKRTRQELRKRLNNKGEEETYEVQMLNNLATTSPNRRNVNCKRCIAIADAP